ncbi:hypothetical protein ALC56_02133 [Trachymyrmex septentrionalis]|uniref:Uncharacterized protein n=1 Tax=Trachymyrmex septentrionalis TaxID=34720 RepID=A0A195FSY0_9HYME|nr:hypothetical protein ALC56_02133 [Trachymyrmex septentrionalis]
MEKRETESLKTMKGRTNIKTKRSIKSDMEKHAREKVHSTLLFRETRSKIERKRISSGSEERKRTQPRREDRERLSTLARARARVYGESRERETRGREKPSGVRRREGEHGRREAKRGGGGKRDTVTVRALNQSSGMQLAATRSRGSTLLGVA